MKQEADELLYQRGLLAAAQTLGPVFIGGSYASDLMCWRDLDLYIHAPTITLAQFFLLGAQLTQQFGAHKAFFTDNRGQSPDGLYWGIRLGDVRQGAWKFDVWALATQAYAATIAATEAFVQRLTPAHRSSILKLKSHYWNTPQYRNRITSAMIYTAVLDHGVATREAFEHYLQTAKQP